MKFLPLAIVALLLGCAAPAPTATPVATYYQGGNLIIDNRGGPAFNILINGAVALSVACGQQASLGSGVDAPPLPWSLEIIRVSDGRVLETAQVDSLPLWLVEFAGGDDPLYLGGPILGPAGPSCAPGY